MFIPLHDGIHPVPVALHVFRMRPYRHVKAFAQQFLQQVVYAAVQDIVRLPGRSDQHLRPDPFCPRRCPVRVIQLFQLAVSAGDQLLFRITEKLLCLADFLKLEIPDAQDRVIVAQGAGMQHHMGAQRIMEHIDIFDVFAVVAALVLVISQVGHGHDHHVRLQLHEQRDQLFLSDIVRNDPRFLFRDLKDLVIRIAGHIVYGQLAVFQDVGNDPLVILIETAALGIENQMFVPHGEKALVVRFLPVFILPAAYGLPAGVGIGGQFLPGFLQVSPVNLLFRRAHPVQHHLLQNSEQVAEDPVEAHSGGHCKSQYQADTDRNRHGGKLCRFALAFLKRIQPVLAQAQDRCRQSCQHRDQQVNPPGRGRRCGKVKAQETRIQVRLPQPHVRMIDDLDQADQQDHLNRHRDHGGERAVMCFFIQKSLFIGYLVRVTEILDLQPVHRRFQANHFDAVCVHPQGYRQQDHLGHKGKQDHSQAVVARQAVGDPHQPAKRRAD